MYHSLVSPTRKINIKEYLEWKLIKYVKRPILYYRGIAFLESSPFNKLDFLHEKNLNSEIGHFKTRSKQIDYATPETK